MTKYIFYTVIFLFGYSLFNSCANPSNPTGGPKDTIPPIRLTTVPQNQSTNFKGKTIFLEFNERLKVAKIKDQLIITPLIEFDYEYTVKKNTLKLEFEEAFSDSTTYTLNFRDAIQDITEGNPTKDNKFTFSTGTYIDSMFIQGYVKDLLTYDTLENITIGLYDVEDTITIFNGSPYYFTEADEQGIFLIENIKNGKYLAYAFKDDNKNLTLETNKEAYAFIKDTINLDSNNFEINLDLIRLDLNEFKNLTSTTSGKYFEINFNKYIVGYDIIPFNHNHKFYTSTSKENKSIRFYNNLIENDSLPVIFTAIDSIDNSVSDTVYIKFSDSRRSKDDLLVRITPESRSAIETDVNMILEFNKPIISYTTDSIFIRYDSTIIDYISDSTFKFNKNLNELRFNFTIDKVKIDTLIEQQKRIIEKQKEEIKKEQEKTEVKQQAKSKSKEPQAQINRGLQIYFGDGSFISADDDTLVSLGINYQFIDPSEYGIQNININTNYQNFTVQIIKENFEIIREIDNEKKIKFDLLEPGMYLIRILIDTNNDGKWSPGNMIKQIEPEPVFIYPETIVIRADWETTLDIAF